MKKLNLNLNLKLKIKKRKKYKKRIKSVNEGETDKLLIRDRKVINDPMYPPERRVPRHIYPKEYIKSK